MEIKIFTKEEADKSVYFSFKDNDYLMNFDNLVTLSKKVIEDKTINPSENLMFLLIHHLICIKQH